MAKRKALATDNDAAVRAVLSPDYVNTSDTEALNIGLALQEVLRGNQAILANQNEHAEMLAKLRERMDKYDRAAAEYENDRNKFIEKVKDRAKSLKVKGDNKEKLLAKAGLQLQEEIQTARAEKVVNNMQFEEMLRRQPKETVTSMGISETILQHGQSVTVMVPEEIRIRHLRWLLPPGVPTVVPKAVAEAFRDRQRLREETAARQAALSRLLEKDKLDAINLDISKRYHSNSTAP